MPRRLSGVAERRGTSEGALAQGRTPTIAVGSDAVREAGRRRNIDSEPFHEGVFELRLERNSVRVQQRSARRRLSCGFAPRPLLTRARLAVRVSRRLTPLERVSQYGGGFATYFVGGTRRRVGGVHVTEVVAAEEEGRGSRGRESDRWECTELGQAGLYLGFPNERQGACTTETECSRTRGENFASRAGARAAAAPPRVAIRGNRASCRKGEAGVHHLQRSRKQTLHRRVRSGQPQVLQGRRS